MLMRVNQRPKSVESGKKAREVFLEEIDLEDSNVYVEHMLQRQATEAKRAAMKSGKAIEEAMNKDIQNS